MDTQECKETCRHIALQTEALGIQPGLDIVINPDTDLQTPALVDENEPKAGEGKEDDDEH